MKKEGLYEARYEVSDGKYTYLMTDRYQAETWDEALGQFAEEAGECYDAYEGFSLCDPYLEVDLYDGRILHLVSLECILDAGKLTRACQFALRYIDNLPAPPMWMPDRTREALRRELVRALEQ